MKTRIVLIPITLLCAAMASVQSARAATITVTNTNDSGPGSLRYALAIANDGDTIDATGVSGTILLTGGELRITCNVTINGPGAANLAVNGNATYRVFENFASNVTISRFTITNGRAADGNGGGGILNHGGLTLSENIVSNNSADLRDAGVGGGICNNPGATLIVAGTTINGNYVLCGEGGGIYTSDAQLTVMNSIISGNGVIDPGYCGGMGGGIFYKGGGTVTVTNSVISGNRAAAGGGMGSDLPSGAVATVTESTISDNVGQGHLGGSGGGIWNYGHTLTVTNCTFSGNSALAAGGIANDVSGNLTVTNCTFSGNSAGAGGGILNSGNLIATNSTFSDNSAASPGGAIYNSGATQIDDTVLKASAFGGTIFNDGGAVTSFGYNLASDDGGSVLTGPGDQINTDPLLGPLQDNGGPTFTHELLPGSPAIDAGDSNFTPPPYYDQRGLYFWRVRNGRIDVGSFEVQTGTRPAPPPRPRPTPHPRLTP